MVGWIEAMAGGMHPLKNSLSSSKVTELLTELSRMMLCVEFSESSSELSVSLLLKYSTEVELWFIHISGLSKGLFTSLNQTKNYILRIVNKTRWIRLLTLEARYHNLSEERGRFRHRSIMCLTNNLLRNTCIQHQVYGQKIVAFRKIWHRAHICQSSERKLQGPSTETYKPFRTNSFIVNNLNHLLFAYICGVEIFRG